MTELHNPVPVDRHWSTEIGLDNNATKKQDFLTRLRPVALGIEIDDIQARGYDISIGSTDDVAYESPQRINDVYESLNNNGKEYSREMGRFDAGRLALLGGIRYAPASSLSEWAKNRLRLREVKAEQLRSNLLYSRLNVMGSPWHNQGGKALALGTIVDAHELNSGDGAGGIYDSQSGRLSSEILDYTFDDNADWLAGLPLHDAIVTAEEKFKSKKKEVAIEKANHDIAQLNDFLTAPIRPGFKDVVGYCVDSLGIRSRKEEVRAEINRHVDQSEKDKFLMMSVGCGTALPMLEVMSDLRAKGREVKLILLDQDPIALAAAEIFADQMGLKDALEIHCEQLFHGKGRSTHLLDLDDILKDRKLDVCEDSGLREYFPDFLYKDLTRQTWEALADDGIMTTGNMNKNRPQVEFLHGLMGWPIPVQMRNISDITDLHKAAGIPKTASRLRVTQDGVYTLCFSSKSLANDSR